MKKAILFLSILSLIFWNIHLALAGEIYDTKNALDKALDKKEDLEKELNTSQTMLQKTQAQINMTQNLVSKTAEEISRKEKEAEDLKKRIELNRVILEEYLREMYYLDENPLENFILSDENISELSVGFDQMTAIKEKVLAVLADIDETKIEVEKNKEELADKKEDHEKLLSIKKGEQVEIKTDIAQAQASLSELNAKINKLKSELTQLLGNSVSFDDVIDAAGFAAKVTNIRKDYLLGVLVVESNLGRYTGGCNFKESRMSGSRAAVFKDICKELDLNYQKQKVSCPPSGYTGTGGAMGVAQFMPDTWEAYKSSISAVTGHNPPNPWNLTDGVVAMALKLTKVDGVTAHKKSAEAKAYCVYLAGGNWAAYCDSKGVNYGEKVLYWADNYEKMLEN